MPTITDTMAADHRRCDLIFSEAEELVAGCDWKQGADRFNAFRAAIDNHFSMEESVLFPRFEQRTGMSTGPTQMMRMEHIQMRQLLSDMAAAIGSQERERYLGLAETLMMLMQQHNMKEERMLYPMTDQALGDDAAQVIGEMEAL